MNFMNCAVKVKLNQKGRFQSLLRQLGCISLFLFLFNSSSVFAQEDIRATVKAKGVEFDVVLIEGKLESKRKMLLNWVKHSADIIATFYDGFPVSNALIALIEVEGDRVDSGKVFGGELPVLNIWVGKNIKQENLDNDWVLIHEMAHLGIANVIRKHRWLEEGLAVYVESVSRLQVGELEEDYVWRGFIEGMPHGVMQADEQGLSNTATWGSVYWGGALFCLLVDIEIRKSTNNTLGLRDALRVIAKSGYTMEREAPIEKLMRLGDEAVDVKAFTKYYDLLAKQHTAVDLEKLWRELGVLRKGNNITYDNNAPLASIRKRLLNPDS